MIHYFFSRKTIYLPNWRGLIILFIVFAALIGLYQRYILDWLQPVRPLPCTTLIVEGWIPTPALDSVKRHFEEGGYTLLIATGSPYQSGFYLSEYPSTGHVVAASLVHLGLDSAQVIAVSAPFVQKDRTYASAVAVRQWLAQDRPDIKQVNVLTVGAHAKRSWTLFSWAMEGQADVGIICVPEPSYHAGNWWTNSFGVKAVLSETIYLIYTYLFFNEKDGI